MIQRYTIKFGSAVSQKELEKTVDEPGETPVRPNLHKMKVRIEIIADFEDLQKLKEFLQEHSRD